MSNTSDYPHDLRRAVYGAVDWKWLLALGIVMLVGGIVAILFPLIASLATLAIAGATFLISGAMQLWMAFSDSGDETSDRWINGLLGVALVALSIALLVNPLAGLISLTLLVGVMFVLFGILRTIMGINARPREGWGWMTATGVVSLALGILVIFSLPEGALGLLGLFLGIDLISSGTVATMMALRKRRAG